MWLMYHDPGVRQAVSELLLSGCQQEFPHVAGLPRGHWKLDVLHGVIDTRAVQQSLNHLCMMLQQNVDLDSSPSHVPTMAAMG